VENTRTLISLVDDNYQHLNNWAHFLSDENVDRQFQILLHYFYEVEMADDLKIF